MGVIYKPTPMYESDINEMVEELSKGGPGSGIRGHRTAKKFKPSKKPSGSPAPQELKEGARVKLKANEAEGWGEEHGEIVGEPKNGVVMVQVDEEHLQDPSDDGLREVELDQIVLKKGGPGSGIKGHTTVRRERYKWGVMRHLQPHNESSSNPKVPVHPEHWKEMQAVHEGRKESSSFKDETGKEWKVSKHPEGGVHVKHESVRGKWEHHVPEKEMHTDAGIERNREIAENEAKKDPEARKRKLSEVAGHAYERMKQKQSRSAMTRHFKLVSQQDRES